MRTQVRTIALALVLSGCTAGVPPRAGELLLRSAWESAGGLDFRLEVEPVQVVAAEPLAIELYVARPRGERQAGESLLAGRFVFTWVPAGRPISGRALASYETFSGAGGIDHSGVVPVRFELLAPTAPGRYWLTATVQSTPDDIQGFLRVARISAAAGPWWRGTRSARPVLVEVTPAGARRRRCRRRSAGPGGRAPPRRRAGSAAAG